MTDPSGAAGRRPRLPQEVQTELERVAERWQQLPLGHALSALPAVRTLVQGLADDVALLEGRPGEPVPDLGPSVVVDQLRVVAWDAAVGYGVADVASRLASLRVQLGEPSGPAQGRTGQDRRS